MPGTSNAQHNVELASKFREAADHLDKRTPLGLLDVKLFLLSALNDTDRALDYGKPGAGLDAILGGKDRPINAEADHG